MTREVYGRNGDKVVVLDVRDICGGEYSVEVLNGCGYYSVYTSSSLEKCIAKAKQMAEN